MDVPYQAELTVIHKPLKLTTNQRGKKVRIITDSRSSVQKLANLVVNNKPESETENSIQDLLETMATRQQELTLVWSQDTSILPKMN